MPRITYPTPTLLRAHTRAVVDHAMQGDSVSAMDAYMKRMAQKEAEKEAQEQEEEERRKRSEPLLNETSFDRRKASRRSLGTRLLCCLHPTCLTLR